jgi:hypothetical protein
MECSGMASKSPHMWQLKEGGREGGRNEGRKGGRASVNMWTGTLGREGEISGERKRGREEGREGGREGGQAPFPPCPPALLHGGGGERRVPYAVPAGVDPRVGGLIEAVHVQEPALVGGKAHGLQVQGVRVLRAGGREGGREGGKSLRCISLEGGREGGRGEEG